MWLRSTRNNLSFHFSSIIYFQTFCGKTVHKALGTNPNNTAEKGWIAVTTPWNWNCNNCMLRPLWCQIKLTVWQWGSVEWSVIYLEVQFKWFNSSEISFYPGMKQRNENSPSMTASTAPPAQNSISIYKQKEQKETADYKLNCTAYNN